MRKLTILKDLLALKILTTSSFMKKSLINYKSIFFVFLFLFSTIVTQSFAMSIGRDGESYEENDISWQPVKFNENNQGFRAAFPGEPMSGISSPWYYIYSKHGMSEYEIHTHMNERYLLPDTEKEFLDTVQKTLGENEFLTPLNISDSVVRFSAQIMTSDIDTGQLVKMWRIYWTSDNRMYYAIIAGEDFSAAAAFFSKITFTSDGNSKMP
jgi:hypothetical protein